MNKISHREEAKLADIVSAAIDKINAGNDPDDTVIKYATEQNLTADATARVCETLNKVMSIHHLATTDSIKRASAFHLIDSSDVLRRLADTRKCASDPVVFRKSANDGVAKVDERARIREMFKLSDLEITKRDLPKLHAKYASDVEETEKAIQAYDAAQENTRVGELDCNKAFSELQEAAVKLNNDDAVDLANYIESTYGEEGKSLIKMLNSAMDGAQLSGDLPDVKEASAWVSTNTKVHRAVDSFFNKVKNFRQNVEHADLAVKKASDYADAIIGDISNITKAEEALIKSPEKLTKDIEEPMSLGSFRKFNDLNVKDTFANLYLSDDFLRQYRPEVVRDAYNTLIQSIPQLFKRPNSDALIKAMVKRLVTSNNQVDPMEVKTMTDIGKAISDAKYREENALWS